MDRNIERADDALRKASQNGSKMAQALANTCDYYTSPYPRACSPTTGKVSNSIIELQTIHHDMRVGAFLWSAASSGGVRRHFSGKVNKRMKKVEQALVKKFGVITVDDEADPPICRMRNELFMSWL